MKIIELPYAPFNPTYTNGKMNIPTGYKVVDGYLYAENPDTEFSDVIKSSNALSFNTLVDLPLKRNNDADDLNKYDPKIHHSDFYTIKYVYDSFTCQLKRENLDVSGTVTGEPTMDVIFKPTNTINSKFLFTLKMTGNNYYIGEEDFPLVILASRNNEKAIFTNDYLNYIRTGYNYDLKKNSNSIIASVVGSSLSIAGGLAMTAVGGGFGKAIGLSTALSGATAIANIINQSVTSSNSMKEKLQTMAYQSTSVSGSDDLDLFNSYSDNVLKMEIYEPRGDVKSMIKNLFYYYGYKCNVFGIPDLNTRYWFNYIQADIVLDETTKPDGMDDEMRNDFTNAFTEGVTVFHYHDLFPHYELSQTCYNYEVDIYNHMPE